MDSPHRQGDKLRRQGRQLVGKVRAELTARVVEVGTGAHEVLPVCHQPQVPGVGAGSPPATASSRSSSVIAAGSKNMRSESSPQGTAQAQSDNRAHSAQH